MSRRLRCGLSVAMVLVVGVLNLSPARTLAFSSAQSSKVELPNPGDLKITAQVNKDSTTGALVLEWTLRNSSTRDLSIRNTNLLSDYTIEVTDRRNKAVPLTEYGQKQMLASRMISRKPDVTIHPGEEMSSRIVISEMYDMKRKGMYVITLKRRFGPTLVKSNQVRTKVSD